jgi:sec-independent protein translocase protein TatB
VFGNLGWGEVLLLIVVGFVVFGPERLPRAAADAMKMLRQLRTMARGAADDLKSELGPEMADLDLASLHPRRIMASMLDDDDEPAGVNTVVRTDGKQPLGPDESPPYDVDAT